MKRFTARLVSLLLAGAVCLSLLAGCSIEKPDDPFVDTGADTPPITDPNEQLPSDNIEPSEGQVPDTPAISEDPEVNEDPIEEPQENPSDELPPEELLDPNEELNPEEEVVELPREKFDLPYPIVSLTEEDAKLCLAQTTEVDYDYFTDAVFLGDSVTLGLRNYATKKRKKNPDFLSNASFIAVGSYGVYEALKTPSETTIHALYNGAQTQPQDILADMGAKTVFICLGLNDVGLFSMKDHLTHYATLILRIQMACPGIKIVIMSTTPLTVEGEKKHLYNYKIDTYNQAVIALAEKYNCYYADIASVLKDEEGYLANELSSDNYCHLENEAYDKIIYYLRTHATPDAVESESENRETVIEPPAEVEGYEGEMGEK